MQNLQTLKKHQLEKLQHEVREEMRKRYKHSRAPKYGSLDKAYNEEELRLLLQHLHHPKARTILALMYGLGLRIGEACRQKTIDVDISGKRLWVSQTEKGSVPTMFFLHDEILEVLKEHIAQGRSGDEWFFPAVKASNKHPHISPGWVAREIRDARKAAGLNFCYGYSEESVPGRKSRPLYRLVSHSCRHYFGHKVFDGTKDILITQKLMRHASIRNTQRYMFKGQEEIDRALLRVFS